MHTLCKSCGQVTHRPETAPSDHPRIWLSKYQLEPNRCSRTKTAQCLRRWRANGWMFTRKRVSPSCKDRYWRGEFQHTNSLPDVITVRVPIN